MIVIISAVIVGAVIGGLTLLRGWALSVLWSWFMVPIFHAPPLSIAQATAVSLVVSLLCHQQIPQKDDETWDAITYPLLVPLIAVAIGWIVKGYI